MAIGHGLSQPGAGRSGRAVGYAFRVAGGARIPDDGGACRAGSGRSAAHGDSRAGGKRQDDTAAMAGRHRGAAEPAERDAPPTAPHPLRAAPAHPRPPECSAGPALLPRSHREHARGCPTDGVGGPGPHGRTGTAAHRRPRRSATAAPRTHQSMAAGTPRGLPAGICPRHHAPYGCTRTLARRLGLHGADRTADEQTGCAGLRHPLALCCSSRPRTGGEFQGGRARTA